MATCDELERIVFWSDNKPVDSWPLSASSAATNNPVDNLKVVSPTLTWKSNVSATSHWIEGAATGPGIIPQEMTGRAGIVLVNPIFAESDTVANFKAYSLPVGGSLIYDQTFSVYNYNALGATERELIGETKPYFSRAYYINLDDWSGGNMGRWRITFASSSSQVAELGYAFVTKAFQPSKDTPRKPSLGQIDKTQVKESWGGNQFSNNRPFKNSLEIQAPDLIIPTDIFEWMRLTSVNGKREPIFVDPHPRYPDSNFLASEGVEAAYNLLWQLYGTMDSSVRIWRESRNVTKMSGRMFVAESL